MPVQTVWDLLDGLNASRLLEPPQLEELLRVHPPANGDLLGMQTYLQQSGWLTPFQLQSILDGSSNAFQFGEYRIIDRLSEDASGVCLKAQQGPKPGSSHGFNSESSPGSNPKVNPQPLLLWWLNANYLQPADTESRFLQQIRQAACVSHPHLVNVLNAGKLDEKLFLVQEFIDGADLNYFVREMGALPLELACDYILQAAQGLEFAHQQMITHGDLHPGNLILSPIKRYPSKTGGLEPRIRPAAGAKIKVAETGLIPLRPPLELAVGTDNPVLANCEYLPPERIHRNAPDILGDVYSLGACFYCLLAGRPPFGKTSQAELLSNLQQLNPVPIQQLRADVPGEIAQLIEQMLEKQPFNRPNGMSEIVARLTPFTIKATTPAKPSPALSSAEKAAQPTASDPLLPTWEPLTEEDNAFHFGSSPPARSTPSSESIFHHTDVSEHEPIIEEEIVVKKGQSTKYWLMAILGVLFHVSAITVLILYLSGAFNSNKTEPETTSEGQKEPIPKVDTKPKNKKSGSEKR